MIRSMKDQGLSISEISRRLGISRTTVRRYLKSGKVPQYHRDPAGSMIETFLPLVREMIDRHNLSAVRIYEELRKKGFKGSYSLVKQYSRPMRNDRKILAVYRYETDRLHRNRRKKKETVCIQHDPWIFQDEVCRVHHGRQHTQRDPHAPQCLQAFWRIHGYHTF